MLYLMKNKITASVLAFSLFAPLLAQAEPFTLKYQKENRWVAKEDAKPLRSLIKEAKAKKQRIFSVILPEEKRDISIERLVVIRDILEQQTKQGIIIEEQVGNTKANTIVIGFRK